MDVEKQLNKTKNKKMDHILIGLAFGLVVPVLAMHFILTYYSNLSLMYIVQNDFFSPIVDSLKAALFLNLGVFFLFFWTKKDKSARGVILATFVYGGFYLWYKFFS